MTAPAFRRLVLDLSHHGGARMDLGAVAALARWLALDLVGVFVEDEALLALAAHPDARELRLPDRAWHPLGAERMAEELAAAAARARRRLEEEAAGAHCAARFEQLRGDPAEAVAAMLAGSDIVAVAAAGATADLVTGIAARARAAALVSAASVLLLPPRGAPRGGPVAALAAPGAEAGVALSARIAAAAGETLVLLRTAGAMDDAALRALAAEAGLDPARLDLRPMPETSAEGLRRRLGDGRLLVVTRTEASVPVAFGAARSLPVLLTEPAPG